MDFQISCPVAQKSFHSSMITVAKTGLLLHILLLKQYKQSQCNINNSDNFNNHLSIKHLLIWFPPCIVPCFLQLKLSSPISGVETGWEGEVYHYYLDHLSFLGGGD